MDALENISEAVGSLLAEEASERVPLVTCTVERPLGPEDLAEYIGAAGQLQTTQKSDEKDIQVLRARHHSVARYLAMGISEGVVAELTGFTPSYLSTLKNNPSMLELIAHYRAPSTSITQEISEQLRTAGVSALMSLIEDLAQGRVDINQKIQIAKLGVDRSGNGPSSTQHNINETRIVDVAEVAKLALEARRREDGRIIDINEVRKLLPAPPAEDDLGQR